MIHLKNFWSYISQTYQILYDLIIKGIDQERQAYF